MARSKCGRPLALILAAVVGGCGLTVPEKNVFVDDNVGPGHPSPGGLYENFIIGHIRCELANGAYKAKRLGVNWFFPLPARVVDKYRTKPRLRLAAVAPAAAPPPDPPPVINLGWGALVTFKIQVQDQTGLNPGVSLTTPFENSVKTFPVGGNVTSPQSFSLGLGLSGSVVATRVETISFTYLFFDLIKEVESCRKFETGILIDSDLKIEQFITDKATIAGPGEAATGRAEYPPFSAFQDDITFVASYNANATPTWKFAAITANSTTPLVGATRTSINEVIITLGPVAKEATPFAPAALSPDAQNIHGSSLIGSATSSASSAQGH